MQEDFRIYCGSDIDKPVCLISADYYSFHSRIPFGYHTLLNPYSYATGSAIPGLVSCFFSYFLLISDLKDYNT